MNLKDKVGLAANQCATSKGLIEGISLFVTKKGLIKKQLTKKDEKYAHLYVKSGKLTVDYAAKKEEKKPETKGAKAGTVKADKA